MARGLPAKYAKMGFKRGWKAYKATKKGRKKTVTRTRRKRRVTKTAKRNNYRKKALSISSGLSPKGMMMDLGWGYIGFTLLGGTPRAMAVTRMVQGGLSHALGWSGKRRLIYGALDFASIALAQGSFGNGNGGLLGPLMPILAPLRNLARTRPVNG